MMGKQSPERAETCPRHTAHLRVSSKTRSSLQMPALTLALAFWVFLEGTHMPTVGCCQTENFFLPCLLLLLLVQCWEGAVEKCS